MGMRGRGGAVRLAGLLTSSSVAALLIGNGTPPAFAACAITPAANQNSVSNSATINCIAIIGVSVAHDVTNTSTGVLTTGGPAIPSHTGITVNIGSVGGSVVNAGVIQGQVGTGAGLNVVNGSTLTGSIVNSGTITGNLGVNVFLGAEVNGGVNNSGTISVGASGIRISDITTFQGGVVNSGTISGSAGIAINFTTLFAGGVANTGTVVGSLSGIAVKNVATFAGGIGNSGIVEGGIAVSSNQLVTGSITNSGEVFGPIFVTNVAQFNGGAAGAVNNSGLIASGGLGIAFVLDQTVTGGITNSGTVFGSQIGPLAGAIEVNSVSTFTGGIANSGTITAAANGISVTTNIVTFAGGISNAGTITAALDSIFVDHVANFSGGIANAGTLSGIAGVLMQNVSTFSGNISNAGTIAGTRLGISVSIGTLAGNVSNSGRISSVSGSGILISATTLTGSISNSGTISVLRDGIVFLGSSAGGISNSGTITAGGSGIHVEGGNVAGNVSNSGTIFGGNGIVLTNMGTFAGSVVNSGTVIGNVLVSNVAHFGSSAAASIINTGTISGLTAIKAANSAPVSVFDSGVINGTITAVDLTANAPGNTFTLGPGYSITGNVLGQGGDIFQLGGAGAGAFDLSKVGAAAQYQGFTTFNVVSGIWTVSNVFGQAQAWNVDGGTLAGTGTLPAVNVNAGGTLAPGTIGVPGTAMTITGNLAFQPGATYQVTLNAATSTRANVGGTATLAGAAQGTLAGGALSNVTYDLLHAGTRSGTFTGFTLTNDPGFGGTLTYTPTDVLLNLTAQLGTGGGLNQNQQNVANGLNTFFNNGGTLPPAFANLFGLTGANLGNALTALDGEIATGAEHSAFGQMNQFLALLLDPSAFGRGGSTSGGTLPFAPEQAASLPPEIALAYASILKAPPPPTFAQRWTAWAAGFGGSARASGDPVVGSSNVTTSTFGFAAGLDYHVSPDTVFGFSLAGGGTNWSLAQGLGTGRSDAFLAGVYGMTHQGPAYLGGALSFSNNWFTLNRIALADQLTARFQGQDYAARLEGGYRFTLPVGAGLAGITPYAAIQAQNFHTPAFSETDLSGGGFGLSFGAMTGTDTRSELGARFDDPTLLGAMPLILRAKLAWAHDWVGNPALNAAFESLPGAGFTVNGAPIPHNAALTEVGAQLFVTANWSFTARFDGEFASGAQSYAGSGIVRYTW
jgi:uncharacterized protein with beta-barrel porin domain